MNTQIQLIVNSRFDEVQVTKHLFLSTKPNTLIMAIFVYLTYFEKLWKKIKKSMINFHILMRRLIIFKGPKVVPALFFIAMLNMDLCKSQVICTLTCTFFRGKNKNFTTLYDYGNDYAISNNSGWSSYNTLLNGFNIETYWVLTLFMIFKPFVFKISSNLANSKCLFGELEKYLQNYCKVPSKWWTMGKIERVWICKFVWCAIKCMPIMNGTN